MEAGPGSTGLTREAGEERRGEEEPVQSHHTGTAGPGGQGCGKTTIQLKLFGTGNITAHIKKGVTFIDFLYWVFTVKFIASPS